MIRATKGKAFETRHADIKQAIDERIRAKRYITTIPSSRSLAAEFGVNYKTVEKAVSALVKAGMLYRVRGKGTFVASKKEQDRKGQVEKAVIGLVVPDISSNSWMQSAIQGIQSAMEQRCGHVILKAHRQDLRLEREAIRSLEAGRVRGLIALPAVTTDGDDNRRMFAGLRCPFVLIDRYFDDVETNFVGVDNFCGAAEAVRYLIGLGHSRIGHVTGVPAQSAKDRIEGYQQALTQGGIIGRAEWLRHFRENGTPEEADAAWRHWMALAPRPTAIFAANDGMALQLFSAALRLGIRIPHDMSLIGFDDAPVMKIFDLSSVEQPFEDIGRMAVDVVWQAIADRRRTKVIHKILAPRLVKRGSTAAPAAEMNSGDQSLGVAAALDKPVRSDAPIPGGA